MDPRPWMAVSVCYSIMWEKIHIVLLKQFSREFGSINSLNCQTKPTMLCTIIVRIIHVRKENDITSVFVLADLTFPNSE